LGKAKSAIQKKLNEKASSDLGSGFVDYIVTGTSVH